MDIAKELLDSAVRDVESQLGEVNGIQEVIQNLTVEAKSEDDLIQLTVGPPGYLRAMTLDPRVKRLDVETLAEKIMTMVNNSSDLLREEIAEQIQALLPDFDPMDFIPRPEDR